MVGDEGAVIVEDEHAPPRALVEGLWVGEWWMIDGRYVVLLACET